MFSVFYISSHFLPPISPRNKQPAVGTLCWEKSCEFKGMVIHTCEVLRACGPPLFTSFKLTPQRSRNCKFSVQNCIIDPNKSRKVLTYFICFLNMSHCNWVLFGFCEISGNGKKMWNLRIWSQTDKKILSIFSIFSSSICLLWFRFSLLMRKSNHFDEFHD